MNPLSESESELPARVPPRFVPTLTQVVHAAVPGLAARSTVAAPAGDIPPAASAPLAPIAPITPNVPLDLNEQLIHRIMQRVDAALSRNLQLAVTEVVAGHIQLLEPLLRDEIETVIRQTVNTAVAQELQPRP